MSRTVSWLIKLKLKSAILLRFGFSATPSNDKWHGHYYFHSYLFTMCVCACVCAYVHVCVCVCVCVRALINNIISISFLLLLLGCFVICVVIFVHHLGKFTILVGHSLLLPLIMQTQRSSYVYIYINIACDFVIGGRLEYKGDPEKKGYLLNLLTSKDTQQNTRNVFKRQRRANIAMPANTAIYANVPGRLWDKNTHIELWLRVNCKESDIIWQYL